MGNTNQTPGSYFKKINYEAVQTAQKHLKGSRPPRDTLVLISTLPSTEQQLLISHTVDYTREEGLINNAVADRKTTMLHIIVYGRNSNDNSVYTKASQLMELGFTHVYIYIGGLFEWLLLQDIYGADVFKTTAAEVDILKYKPTVNADFATHFGTPGGATALSLEY
jgi:hypothetical protein